MTDANDDTIPSIPVDAPMVRRTYFYPFCAAMSHRPLTAVHLENTRNEQSLMLFFSTQAYQDTPDYTVMMSLNPRTANI